MRNTLSKAHQFHCFFLASSLATFILAPSTHAAPIKLTLQPAPENRRFVVVEQIIPESQLAAPYIVHDSKTGQVLASQWESADGKSTLRFVVPSLEANQSRAFTIEHATDQHVPGNFLLKDNNGALAISTATRQITTYHYGPWAAQFKKPFFYPVIAHGVQVTRGAPMQPKPGEETDHPHHTSLFFAHGEVNGKDYWSKLPISHTRFLKQSSGPVYARLIAENAWGADVVETQDITIYDAGEDVLMDWVISLKATNGPVHLGKTKEGGFGPRVATGLTAKGGGQMMDGKGNKGEPAIRADNAAWADDYGAVDGQPVGIAIMNHPSSFRFPTNWHVRDYGLFVANPFFMQGEYQLTPDKPITLKYRLYIHGGDPAAGKVQEVYAGYTNAQVKAE